jgi:phosphatidylglycerophosphatase A
VVEQVPSFKSPAIWLATWFGCGLMRPAPGTWGTLGALPFGILMLVFGGWPVLLAASVLISLIGYWAAGKYEAASGKHDASEIVIDEVAGMWIALMAVTTAAWTVGLAFLLFRALDIAKPWPVGWADKKLPGALGVMVDDILAGMIAALIVVGVRYGFGS